MKSPSSIIEFGPCPIYAHGSSFSPIAGVMIIMMMTVGAETIIIIVKWIVNYWIWTLSNLGLRIVLFTDRRDYDYYDIL